MLKTLLKLILDINWQAYRPANCLPYHCFCEALRPGIIRQPVNAYSNVIYILVGIFIIIWLIRTRQDRNTTLSASNLPRKTLIIFAIAYFAIGVGSFLYHTSFTFSGQELDDDSMYLLGSFMFLYSWSHFKPVSTKLFLAYYLIINLGFEIIAYFFPVLRGSLFGILIVGMIILEYLARHRNKSSYNPKYFCLSLGTFLLSYIIWALDYTKVLCHPYSPYQGHAVWHILSALAGLLMFFHMDSSLPSTK
jgi:hypothetical protein